MAQRTKGKCKFCGKEYTMSYMNKHLPVCKERQSQFAFSCKFGIHELAFS